MNREETTPLYEQVADRIATLVDKGTFRPGDRVPSIRRLSREMQVSVNTVREAYGYLEDRRVIEARPQSGYYVCARLLEEPSPQRISPRLVLPTEVGVAELAERVVRDIARPDLVQLGPTIPNPDLLPTERLVRMLATQVRRHGREAVSYAIAPGNPRLRTEIAKRSFQAGCSLRPDEIVITSGCVEAVGLALRATCRPGDTLAVESPTYYNFLQLIDQMGLQALEIPSTPGEGISIETLRYALDHAPVHACLVISNFSNPLGAQMPEERKRELVELAAERDIPLIEDDINGDLCHADERPTTLKAFDRSGNVLLCSSFSKTVAPGFRVGWIAPGRHQARVERLKLVLNVASATPTQLAVAEFLANGGYDRHLRAIRREYAKRVAQLGEAIRNHFPEGTRATRPRGGYSVWVELPAAVDCLALYAEALERGVSVAPGPVFSAAGKFRNCLRLNAAFWSERAAQAVELLGRLAKVQVAAGNAESVLRPTLVS